MEAWPLLALGFSLCGAGIIGFNQWARVDGHRLVVLRVLGVWPLVALAAVLLPMPGDWRFYAVAAAMGVGLAYADKLLFDASAAHGGRLTALYIPLKMLLGFILWVVGDPASALPLLAEPWKLGVLLLGFGLCGGALLGMRRVDASWLALLAIIPVAALLTVGDVVAKLALPDGHGSLAAVVGSTAAFLGVTNTVGALTTWLFDGAFRPTRRELWLGFVFGLILLPSLCLLLVTLALAPNPGYVAAITMLSALWLALWAYFKRGEHANWWAGVALLAGAVLVALTG
jgi:hypothetical protein